ncbi:MAG: hypothetical protein RO257_14615 [Candidatus Kapabacteria bacterium]|nr:hypothetical protein [Candidatus Kapabacteria bacterium]
MKKIIVILLFMSFQICLSNYIDDLRKAAKAETGDNLIIFYFEMVECVKCYIEPNEIISHLVQQSDSKNFKIIGVVICDRDIELKLFKKEHNWKYALYRNDGKARTNLNAPYDSFITVVNSKNEKLHLKPGKPEANYNKIIEFISD